MAEIQNIKHIFFDLDRTLWDFDLNSRQTLKEAFEVFELGKHKMNCDEFIRKYEQINAFLWKQYGSNKLTKQELRVKRFANTLAELNVNERPQKSAKDLSAFYLEHSPCKTNLLPHTRSMLNKLSDQFHLHIITNGFDEVQHFKLENSGISPYFDVVMTADAAGCSKPEGKIFESSMQSAGAAPGESLMVGDDWESDIMGARKSGMLQAFFNPKGVSGSDRKTLLNYKQHPELAAVFAP